MIIKYIALLRGINVSGKNKVAMSLLKTAFEVHGFTDVTTYINSGNVMFSSDNQDKLQLIKQCEAIIAENFALEIPVTIISADELVEILAHGPSWWDQDKEAVNYAMFVIPPMTVEEVITVVGEVKPECEKLAYYGNVIFWTAPLKTFSKARWSKIASTSMNRHVTIRNANTTNKLAQLTTK